MGSVRIHDVAADTGEFAMLTADAGAARHWRRPCARRLRRGARPHAGLHAMQLELLLPREVRHPGKEFLEAWYSRIGYRRIRTGSVEESHPARPGPQSF